jgi:DNA-binding transcriptional LysR family regulator
VRYFVAVAEELHFHRAAERLHIAQPSLSHQIRVLEQQLGVSLLTRSSRHVELTDAGRVMLEEGRALLARAQAAVHATRRAGSEDLTIGFYGSAATTLLPELVRDWSDRHPDAALNLREMLLDQFDDLAAGSLDLAFTRLLPGQLGADIAIEILARQPRVVALPAVHPLSRRASIRFADLREEAFITNPTAKGRQPARWLAEQQRHGLPGRVGGEASSLQELLALVAAGRGVSLVPAAVATSHTRPDIAYVAVVDAEAAVISVAWRRADKRPILHALLELARGHAGAGSHAPQARPQARAAADTPAPTRAAGAQVS